MIASKQRSNPRHLHLFIVFMWVLQEHFRHKHSDWQQKYQLLASLRTPYVETDVEEEVWIEFLGSSSMLMGKMLSCITHSHNGEKHRLILFQNINQLAFRLTPALTCMA